MAFWIFKCNPKVYFLDGRLADPKPTITWRVPQHTDQIVQGDIAFLWQTGADRGIRGVMRVDQEPREMEDLESEIKYYRVPGSEEGRRVSEKQWRVLGTLICRKVNLRMAELREVPGLEHLSAFGPLRHTVFPVIQAEGDILCRLTGVSP